MLSFVHACYGYNGRELWRGLALPGQDHGVAVGGVVTPESADDRPALSGKPPRLWTLLAIKARAAWARLGVEQLQGLFIDFHILTKRNGCRLGARDQMQPAPGRTRGVKFFHNRLMMLKGVHLREIIVTHDLRQPRNQRGRIIAALDILLGQVDGLFDFWRRPQLPEIGDRGPV